MVLLWNSTQNNKICYNFWVIRKNTSKLKQFRCNNKFTLPSVCEKNVLFVNKNRKEVTYFRLFLTHEIYFGAITRIYCGRFPCYCLEMLLWFDIICLLLNVERPLWASSALKQTHRSNAIFLRRFLTEKWIIGPTIVSGVMSLDRKKVEFRDQMFIHLGMTTFNSRWRLFCAYFSSPFRI